MNRRGEVEDEGKGDREVPEMAARAGIQNASGESRWAPIKQEAKWKGGYGRWVGGEAGSGQISGLQAHILSLKRGWHPLLRSEMGGNTWRV